MSALQSTLPSQQPNLAPFFDTVQGYQRAFILKAGIDLDIFTAIAEGQTTVRDIARKRGVPERGVRVVCDCLTVMGFLNKNNDHYSLAAESAPFLDSRSPAYMGHALKFLLDPGTLQRTQELTDSVRRGGPPEDSYVVADDQLWVAFARGMAPMMFPAAQAIADLLRSTLADKTATKVLDVAAGHGTFGITLAERFPGVQVYALDSANVLEVAKENATSNGVKQRYHLLPGSAFERHWGADYDAVLITNFLHHFDPETNVALLQRAHAALKPGGQAVILEFVPNDDRVSPPIPAMFAVTMFAGTTRGDVYTFKQLSNICVHAGFKDPRLVALKLSPQSVITAKKPE